MPIHQHKENTVSKTHRTALIVDVRDGVNGVEQERITKLLDSLNRQPSSGPEGTIKVDVYTLDVGGIREGAPNFGQSNVDDDLDPVAFARGLGYVQVIVDTPLGNG